MLTPTDLTHLALRLRAKIPQAQRPEPKPRKSFSGLTLARHLENTTAVRIDRPNTPTFIAPLRCRWEVTSCTTDNATLRLIEFPNQKPLTPSSLDGTCLLVGDDWQTQFTLVRKRSQRKPKETPK